MLSEIAVSGHGSFFAQKPEELSFLGDLVTAKSSLLVRRELVLYNPNTVFRGDRVVPDSDGDGLADEEEVSLGTDPLLGDTDGDQVGDGVEAQIDLPELSFDPRTPSAPVECSLMPEPGVDTDTDGLNDCEEAVLRTDGSLVDSDRDGIPDRIEVLRGGNPLVDDFLTDSDLDGQPNGVELKVGLDVAANDAEAELAFGYRYRLFDEGARTRLDAEPAEPFYGVTITRVFGATEGVGILSYSPGPPPTLAWSDDFMGATWGAPVEVTAAGVYTVASATGRELAMRVSPALLAESGAEGEKRVLIRGTHRFCFHMDVRNVTLVETAEVAGRPGRGWNTIWVYLGQIPDQIPSAHAIFKAATFPIRFLAPDQKTPDAPFITVAEDDFVLLGGEP